MFAGGRSYAQIAEARGNKASTIKNAIYRIQEKVGDRVQARDRGLGGAQRPSGRRRAGRGVSGRAMNRVAAQPA